MEPNLHLFGEPDTVKREEALQALWAKDGMLIDPGGISIAWAHSRIYVSEGLRV